MARPKKYHTEIERLKAKETANGRYRRSEKGRAARKVIIERYLQTEQGKTTSLKCGRAYQLKSLYGITINDYDRMFSKQHNRCAICGVHQSELKKALAVDHNHKTGKVRGLLCPQCNQALGFFEGRLKEFAEQMSLYLDKEI